MTEPQRTPKVYRRDLLLDSQVCGRPRDEALEDWPFHVDPAGGAPRPQSVLNPQISQNKPFWQERS